jgi:UDP-glucose 4-epimerase
MKMAILVTGGLGYVGSHAVKLLMDKGEQVVCLDDLSYGHVDAASGSEVVIGDIGNVNLLKQVFAKYPIDAVMHFAAFASVPESVENPQKYYMNNISKSLVLLQEMLAAGVKNIIFSSTAAVFGEPKVVPIPEDHPKDPTNPYGRSKLHFEEILAEYDQAYGLKWTALRYFNASGADPSGTIGEDHKPEHHLIPIVLDVVLGKREKVSLFGTDWPTPDGTCVRDYVHVTDLAQAHYLALDALKSGAPSTVYNMGNGSGYSVKEVVNIAEEVTGKKIQAVEAPRRAGDPARLVASSDKIKRELGWNPQYADLRTIIETAWNWHKNHPNGFDDRK